MTSSDDTLDSIALKRLLLLDSLLKKKVMLAEYMKIGFFQLGKARYSLGCHAVSSLRIPVTALTATTKTVSHTEESEECFPHSYRCWNITQLDVADINKTNEAHQKEGGDPKVESSDELAETVLKLAGNKDEAGSQLEDVDLNFEIIDEDELDDPLSKEACKKPINWFSALPPRSLRQAQTNFESALQLAASCASMQEQLTVIDRQYSLLMEQKLEHL